jgi:Ca-activated chloride channel family protein
MEMDDMEMEMDEDRTAVAAVIARAREKSEGYQRGGDPILDVLGRQAASGLWEEPGKDAIEVTASALVALLRLGVTGAHPVYGAQVKKAVEAVLERLAATPQLDARVAQLALGVAWLMATGRRTKKQVEDAGAARGLSFADETSVRAVVESLA